MKKIYYFLLAGFLLLGTHSQSFGQEHCEQIYEGEPSGNLVVMSADLLIQAAADFYVEPNTKMTLDSIATIVLTQFEDPTSFNLYFYKDNDGKPGELIATYLDIFPEITYHGDLVIFPMYKVNFTFPSALSFEGETEGKTFWVGITSMAASEGGNVDGVAYHLAENNAHPVYQSDDGGISWFVYDSPDGVEEDIVLRVHGMCEDTLGLSEMSVSDFDFYPNPALNELNINSKVSVKKLEVFSLSGENIKNFRANANNTKLDISQLSAGFYIVKATLENGQVETFKVLKK